MLVCRMVREEFAGRFRCRSVEIYAERSNRCADADDPRNVDSTSIELGTFKDGVAPLVSYKYQVTK